MPAAKPTSEARSLSTAVQAQLEDLSSKHPTQGAALVRTYSDLLHAARWQHLEVLDLSGVVGGGAASGATVGRMGLGAVRGLRPEENKLLLVVPCLVSDMLDGASFDGIFSALVTLDDIFPPPQGAPETDRDSVLLGMMAQDASVVYYKLARGIRKPVN